MPLYVYRGRQSAMTSPAVDTQVQAAVVDDGQVGVGRRENGLGFAMKLDEQSTAGCRRQRKVSFLTGPRTLACHDFAINVHAIARREIKTGVGPDLARVDPEGVILGRG